MWHMDPHASSPHSRERETRLTFSRRRTCSWGTPNGHSMAYSKYVCIGGLHAAVVVGRRQGHQPAQHTAVSTLIGQTARESTPHAAQLGARGLLFCWAG
eukprot:309581-Prymnesium_polylepis.1